MKNLKIDLLFLMFPLVLCSQTSLKAYKKLSKAEKCWVITHPFKAKKAYKTTLYVQKVVDSIQIQKSLGSHSIGNQLDAFKHAFWMWNLAEQIGCKAAHSLGKAHEKGNRQFFKKSFKEDGILPDSISTVMDLHNNHIGIQHFKKNKNPHLSTFEKIKILINAVLNGELKMIKQKGKLQFLDLKNQIIPKKIWQQKWNNSKVLIPTKPLQNNQFTIHLNQ